MCPTGTTAPVGFTPAGNLYALPYVVIVPPPLISRINPFCPFLTFAGLFSVIPALTTLAEKSMPKGESGVKISPDGVIATGAAALHAAPGVSIFVGAELA